ncbi:MAG: DUF4340 domain-containing protein [Verrucomicrobiaceae bacterium]|nr:DUF4340 domain-containing protein [Verrucomicrobiaceae bacterium]
MKKIIILLIVLAALVGAALYQQKDRNSRLSTGSRKGADMRTLLLPDFDVNSIQKIRVKDGMNEVNVALKGTAWAVSERGGYEASFDKISRALLALKEQKISRKQIVGKESWGKIGVQPPGEPDAQGIGTLVELLDGKGNLKKSFILGGNVTSSGNQSSSPFGGSNERLIRIPEDGTTIWVVGNTFTDLESKADSWLEKAFLDVQKLKSVEVTAAKPEDSWKASRAKEEDNEFTLEAAKPGEKLDNGKSNLASLLSSPTFNDVLAKDKAAATMKDAVKAKLITFDGFTYNVQAVKQAGKDGAGDKHYLTVAVSADIAKERAPVKDEKAEDKKKNDESFVEEKKKKEEKLAAEKKLEGWVYEVSDYTLGSLLKKRAEILAEPEKAGSPAAGSAPAGGLPDVKKMLQSVPPAPAPVSPPPSLATPPSTPLPETPKTEIKPAPAPGSNPVTGTKPVEPPKPAPEAAKK